MAVRRAATRVSGLGGWDQGSSCGNVESSWPRVTAPVPIVPRDPEPRHARDSVFGRLPDDPWSRIARRQPSGGPGALELLEGLCREYWYPLYAVPSPGGLWPGGCW